MFQRESSTSIIAIPRKKRRKEIKKRNEETRGSFHKLRFTERRRNLSVKANFNLA